MERGRETKKGREGNENRKGGVAQPHKISEVDAYARKQSNCKIMYCIASFCLFNEECNTFTFINIMLTDNSTAVALTVVKPWREKQDVYHHKSSTIMRSPQNVF